MALGINFDADIAAVESDLPQTVTIDGTSYSAVVSDVSLGHNLQFAGYMPDADLSVTIRTAVLPRASITNGIKLTFSGKTYRAEKVTDCPSGAAYEIACVSVTK
jgi:hypothetical protein